MMVGVDGATTGILTLGEEAQAGLNNSPVPLNLAALSPDGIEQVGIGSYLVNVVSGCGECHSKSPAPTDYLTGGIVFPIPGPGNYSVVTRNLTPDPATGLKDTADQFLNSIRSGTDILNANESLLIEPWQVYRWQAQTDIKAMYAFLQVIPPVKNAYGSDNKPMVPPIPYPSSYTEGEVVRPLPPETDAMGNPNPDPNHILRGLAIVPLNVVHPTDAATLALFGQGSYIVNAEAGCGECHSNPARDMTMPNNLNTGGYLSGGQVFPVSLMGLGAQFGVTRSMSANLIGKTHGYFNNPAVTFEVFLETITLGIHAEDAAADAGSPAPLAYPMPWFRLKNMTPGDLLAVYTYLKWMATNDARTGANDKITQAAARYCTATSMCNPGESCNTMTNECVGRVCAVNTDCDACQTCPSGTCVAPAATSMCPLAGI